jgi:GTPase
MCAQVVLLHDLAGHEKYHKTTLIGFTGQYPDHSMLVIAADANTRDLQTATDHLSLAVELGLPVFVVVTKTDSCDPAQLERVGVFYLVFYLIIISDIFFTYSQTVHAVREMIQVTGRIPIVATSLAPHPDIEASDPADMFTCPVFLVSSVSRDGVQAVEQYLTRLRPRPVSPVPGDSLKTSRSDVHFSIDSRFK